MNVGFFDNRRVRQILTILMLFGALTCIFPPLHPVFRWWADHAVFVALGYLFAALFFLVINNPRLMFVCLGCSAAICFFKNELGDTAPVTGSRGVPAFFSTCRPSEGPCPAAVSPQPDTTDEFSETH